MIDLDELERSLANADHAADWALKAHNALPVLLAELRAYRLLERATKDKS